MLKYSGNTINDWNYGTSNLIKVYRNNAIVYYKVSGESPTPEYKVCFAVVDDISQYQETEFEDVFDKATDKWYKLNNLNQYEEYGIYGSGRTSCEGSTSRLPQGYTEVEYIRQNSNYNAYINTGVIIFDNTTNTYTITTRLTSEFNSNLGCATIISCEGISSPYNGLGYRYKCSSTVDQLEFFGGNANYNSSVVDNGDGTRTVTFQSTGNTSYTTNVPLSFLCSFNDSSYTSAYRFADATIYSSTVVKNGITVRDFVPAMRNSDSKYGLYDLITDTFYISPNGNDFSGGSPVTPTDCVTTYNGKLTIDDSYEYEWNGSSWVNVGEVSGSSRLPQGYTEVEYITAENLASGITGPYIDTNFTPNQNTRVVLDYQAIVNGQNNRRIFGSGRFNNTSSGNYIWSMENRIGQSNCYYYYKFDNGASTWSTTSLHPDLNRHTVDFNKEGKIWLDDTAVVTLPSNTVNCSYHLGLFNEIGTKTETNIYEYFQGRIYSCQVYDNGTLVRDLVPCTNSSNVVGMYDIVGNTFYSSARQSYQFDAGSSVAPPIVYPITYDEKSDPLNDLTFNTLAEAQTYAYNNCVYDGMHATIDGDRYYFNSEDENGWVKILEYYKVEDVTPNQASGWTISGSSTYNPDSSYYDDFDLETTSTSNVTKIAKVTIYGYNHFTYYLRTSGYSNNNYVVATNVDEIQTPPASMSYNSSSAITTTYYWNKSPKSDVNLSNYRRVTYNNLDKTVEHTFYVYFYGRTYSSYVGNATILIPKEQTNENWEQVTFSASSNVASAQKNLYIDGNNSTSGGTQYWYYRWIVGLPSGSHSSYTNYSNYNYCGNVTSSTFTSVSGETRQVNFTYDNTSNKSLSFRLTDGSNVLTPSDTVYYNMTYYNSCGVSSSSSNVTFPRSQSVKVGGSFSFSNSSNRHYIYGYQPPTLGTRYYVDNYQSTFDITYTKLSEEAVVITYTAYDPNDVEIPAFNTDITYPYNGGTTSSTTLTSFDVPYTYPYTVKQTNAKFSADSQSYTANQAARTISFTLYPNNREFATVADLEAYQYAWEGMTATVGDTKYKYENGEWVENTHSLPDVPFVLNYNAKQYDATTHTIAMTDGQLNGTDAIAYTNPNNIVDHSSDGYITISSSSMRIRKENQDIALFNRSSNSTSSDLTIVCKAKTWQGENIITNRDSNYNWMYRLKPGTLRFHGTSETGGINWDKNNPVIMSVRTYYDNGTKLKYNNWTQNTSTTPISFTYGSTNGDTSKAGALFVGYSWSNTSEQWSGDFYWVYMAQANLTDEQIQQVIDYNENL